jgi:hypothetical protein
LPVAGKHDHTLHFLLIGIAKKIDRYGFRRAKIEAGPGDVL